MRLLRTSSVPPSRRRARSGAVRRCTRPTSAAGCTTRWPTRRAASASTTTRPSRSPGCSPTALSGSPTSTSTSTTATGCRRPSTTTHGSSRSACTRPRRPASRAPDSPARAAGPGPRGPRSTWRCRPGPATAGGCGRSTPWCRRRSREFAPDILVSQHGCDSHMDDPLAHLMLSVDGQRAAHLALHDLAHEVCDGRWLVTGGGGYEVVNVVPRTWTHLLAVVGGQPLDPQTRDAAGVAAVRRGADRARSAASG